MDVMGPCGTCRGLGHIEDEPCEVCLGTRTATVRQCRCAAVLRRAWPAGDSVHVGTVAAYTCTNGHAYWHTVGSTVWEQAGALTLAGVA
jgi:hypothetical protein